MFSSSMFGIIFGGLMKGIEKDGFMRRFARPGADLYLMKSKREHNLYLIGNGSNAKSLPSLK
jgi:hypothetical protein